jgi:hypothetical protein
MKWHCTFIFTSFRTNHSLHFHLCLPVYKTWSSLLLCTTWIVFCPYPTISTPNFCITCLPGPSTQFPTWKIWSKKTVSFWAMPILWEKHVKCSLIYGMRAKFYKTYGEHLQNVLTGFSESCRNFILSKKINTSKIKGHKKISFTAVQNRKQNYTFILIEVFSYPTLVSCNVSKLSFI